jgi:hypothetical protein
MDATNVADEIAGNLAGADQIAVERVQTLAWAHRARAVQLLRTAASLRTKYGSGDSGAKSAEAAADAAKATAAQIDVVHRQVTTADPQVSANGWALHGRVLDAQLAPSTAYTVFLVDSAKTYQQAFGFAYTDDTGYFLLNFAGSGKTRSSAAPEAAATPELFVEVVDNYARPVFLSTSAFQPATGSATYQNIVLPEGQPPIGDPPPEIRQVAIPKPGKGKKS